MSKTQVAANEISETETAEEGTKKRKTRAKKPSFDLATAVDAEGESIALNEDGAMTAVPHNYNSDETRMPTRGDFATIDLYFDFREFRESQEHQERMAELSAQRTEAINGPDPVKTNIKKFKKLVGNVEDLKAALQEAGVDISELLG